MLCGRAVPSDDVFYAFFSSQLSGLMLNDVLYIVTGAVVMRLSKILDLAQSRNLEEVVTVGDVKDRWVARSIDSVLEIPLFYITNILSRTSNFLKGPVLRGCDFV